jgi:hypothetical protein
VVPPLSRSLPRVCARARGRKRWAGPPRRGGDQAPASRSSRRGWGYQGCLACACVRAIGDEGEVCPPRLLLADACVTAGFAAIGITPRDHPALPDRERTPQGDTLKDADATTRSETSATACRAIPGQPAVRPSPAGLRAGIANAPEHCYCGPYAMWVASRA